MSENPKTQEKKGLLDILPSSVRKVLSEQFSTLAVKLKPKENTSQEEAKELEPSDMKLAELHAKKKSTNWFKKIRFEAKKLAIPLTKVAVATLGIGYFTGLVPAVAIVGGVVTVIKVNDWISKKNFENDLKKKKAEEDECILKKAESNFLQSSKEPSANLIIVTEEGEERITEDKKKVDKIIRFNTEVKKNSLVLIGRYKRHLAVILNTGENDKFALSEEELKDDDKDIFIQNLIEYLVANPDKIKVENILQFVSLLHNLVKDSVSQSANDKPSKDTVSLDKIKVQALLDNLSRIDQREVLKINNEAIADPVNIEKGDDIELKEYKKGLVDYLNLVEEKIQKKEKRDNKKLINDTINQSNNQSNNHLSRSLIKMLEASNVVEEYKINFINALFILNSKGRPLDYIQLKKLVKEFQKLKETPQTEFINTLFDNKILDYKYQNRSNYDNDPKRLNEETDLTYFEQLITNNDSDVNQVELNKFIEIQKNKKNISFIPQFIVELASLNIDKVTKIQVINKLKQLSKRKSANQEGSFVNFTREEVWTVINTVQNPDFTITDTIQQDVKPSKEFIDDEKPLKSFGFKFTNNRKVHSVLDKEAEFGDDTYADILDKWQKIKLQISNTFRPSSGQLKELAKYEKGIKIVILVGMRIYNKGCVRPADELEIPETYIKLDEVIDINSISVKLGANKIAHSVTVFYTLKS